MPRRYWLYIAPLALGALGLFFYSGAHAQAPGSYDCEIDVYAGGAFDAHCEPDATETPIVTATATLTPVVIVTDTPTTQPTATATATRTPTATATQTAPPTATNTPAAQTAAPRFAVMGDSFFDEYRADNNRGGAYAATTLNMVEILQRVRGFDFGPWGTWGGVRRTGYENNCAQSGATSYSMIQSGQHTCVASILAAGKADYVLVGIGANDFSPNFGSTYSDIYSGRMSDADLTAKINRAVQDVTTGVDAALGAGARGVLVVSFTQWGLDPSIASRFPNAAGRQRVDNAIDRVNSGLEAMAAARGGRVFVVDQNAIGSTLILPKLDAAGNFTVAGEKISFLTNGDEPHHAKLGDGAHLGTVMSGFMANHYFIGPLNAAFGFNIPPLSEGEMLSVAGLRPTGTPVPTATPTRAPPTATTAPATATPVTAVTPAPAAGLVVNVPLLDVLAGAPELDANNRAIVWAGAISPAGGYTQVRLIGRGDGLSVYAQQMAPTLAGGQFTLTINGRVYPVAAGGAPGWTLANRCGGGDCRGWTALRAIPWVDLGGRPSDGDVWPLALTAPNGEWRGSLRWGLPNYAGRAVAGAQTTSVLVSADAALGGGTDCGTDDDPAYFPTWGSRNTGRYGTNTLGLGAMPYANVQAQWDVADWPCFSRYIARWPAPSLPEGAQVVSATLDLWYFGASYPGPNDAQEFAPHMLVQAFTVGDDWEEDTVTWDNAPPAGENISRTAFDWCDTGIDCYGWRSVDVTEIVRRGGNSVLLYTAAGQYHAGRYFYTREGSRKPLLRVAYVLEGQPAWTPTATRAASTTSTPTPTATALFATATPTASPTPAPPTAAPSATPTATATQGANGAACTRTVSPGGLTAAVAAARPGDVLCLRDGVYAEPLTPRVNGTSSAPITVKALNDGKATIDGQGVRKTVDLQRDYWIIEGIVARNGLDNVFRVDGNNNVLRRVSAYDASDDINSSVIMLLGDNNLVEDAIVAGTGRYMAEIFEGSGNTLRRVFTMWEGWAGRQFCGVAWPNGNNIGIYNASNATVENAIAYGRSLKGVMVQANSDTAVASNNHVLGSLAVLQGRNYDGSAWTYGTGQAQPTSRPGPTSCTSLLAWSSGAQRYGIGLWGQGTMQGNVFRDVIAADNVGVGFSARRPYMAGAVSGNVVERATLTGNGADVPSWEADQGRNVSISMAGVDVRDSRIAGAPASIPQGQGARLQRYVNGQPQGGSLIPWPMESRAVSELGVSVNAIISEYAGR